MFRKVTMPNSNYIIHRGEQPLVVTMPHVGTFIPKYIEDNLSEEGKKLIDTDWHLDRLYNFAKNLGATVIIAKYSRYVVDLNRPPDNKSLYPGKITTSLCPTETFDGESIYRPGFILTDEEIFDRKKRYWQPWHDCLQQELTRLKAIHGTVQLWDAHSIRSILPLHFSGKLPDFNLGTNDGASCSHDRLQTAIDVISSSSEVTHVVNGRYKGGYITRHYGQPNNGIHAIQLELAQSSYMRELNPDYWDEQQTDVVRLLLQTVLGNFCLSRSSK